MPEPKLLNRLLHRRKGSAGAHAEKAEDNKEITDQADNVQNKETDNSPPDPIGEGVISESDFDDIMKILRKTRRNTTDYNR